MERRVLWTVVLVLASVLSVAACGDDADDESTTGGAGKTGGVAGDNGGGRVTCDPGEMTCGTECCGAPTGVTPCCSDEVTSQCGMMGGFGMAQSCVKAVPDHATCPGVQLFPGFRLSSCCTAGMCGINAGIFNASGCTELGEAARMAMEMAMDFMPPTAGTTGGDDDAGVAGSGAAGRTGGGAGRFGGMFPLPMFPPPQTCTP